MRLSHLHLPKPIPYAYALRLQEILVNKHYTHKSALRSATLVHSNSKVPTPEPTLLTFQTEPTYTVGRRHLTQNPLSDTQIAYLTGKTERLKGVTLSGAPTTVQHNDLATFFASPRGGLLTYHAPGQLTAFLVLDLRAHKLTPRCYIRLLESTVIQTCARWGVPNTMTTDDPGVWISIKDKQQSRATDRKICAIGVHVSRGITSHGIGLNVLDQPINDVDNLYTVSKDNPYVRGSESQHDIANQPVIAAPGYLSWGFSRIVACGLEGKSVTWIKREADALTEGSRLTVQNVAGTLAQETAKSLGLDLEAQGIQVLKEQDILTG